LIWVGYRPMHATSPARVTLVGLTLSDDLVIFVAR
jgi:hypothetical protein